MDTKANLASMVFAHQIIILYTLIIAIVNIMFWDHCLLGRVRPQQERLPMPDPHEHVDRRRKYVRRMQTEHRVCLLLPRRKLRQYVHSIPEEFLQHAHGRVRCERLLKPS